jgi:HEAT repeat protein
MPPDDYLATLQDQTQPKDRRLAAIKALGVPGNHKAILPLQAAMHEEPLANACSHALIHIRSRRHLRRVVNLLKPNTPDYLKQ